VVVPANYPRWSGGAGFQTRMNPQGERFRQANNSCPSFVAKRFPFPPKLDNYPLSTYAWVGHQISGRDRERLDYTPKHTADWRPCCSTADVRSMKQGRSMSFIREPNTEPIPGYRLVEPLGTGGFGEVWKCEAPGGLYKAIKFIYGNLNSLDV